MVRNFGTSDIDADIAVTLYQSIPKISGKNIFKCQYFSCNSLQMFPMKFSNPLLHDWTQTPSPFLLPNTSRGHVIRTSYNFSMNLCTEKLKHRVLWPLILTVLVSVAMILPHFYQQEIRERQVVTLLKVRIAGCMTSDMDADRARKYLFFIH